MTEDDAAFLAAFDALPLGTFTAEIAGRRWILTRTAFAGGRAEKLVGHAADGSDTVSANLYRLSRGPRLAPCQMPEAKVRAVVRALMPVRPDDASTVSALRRRKPGGTP